MKACPHCGSSISLGRKGKAFAAHRERCKVANEEERKHYVEKRRWPSKRRRSARGEA